MWKKNTFNIVQKRSFLGTAQDNLACFHSVRFFSIKNMLNSLWNFLRNKGYLTIRHLSYTVHGITIWSNVDPHPEYYTNTKPEGVYKDERRMHN